MFKYTLFLLASYALFARSAVSSTPVILNYTESVGSSEVMYIQGSNFGSSPIIQYSYNDSNWIQVPTITAGNGTVTFKMPGSETRLPDVFTIRVSPDGINWSAPVFINKPDPSFVSTDQIAPGAAFRIFGRNLYFSRTPGVRLVDEADGSSQNASVNVTTSQHFMLSAVAPTGIVIGHRYRLYVSNGYSGNALTLVESMLPEALVGRSAGTDYWHLGLPWAADFNFFTNVYNVKTDSRLNHILATGDNVANDIWPINHAIQVAAAAGGGVVYLPAGTYALHFANGCGINLLPNVVLQGAGAAGVTINYGYAGGTTGGFGACFTGHSGLVDVTMNNVDRSQAWQFSGLSANASEVFLKRVNWNLGTSQWLNFVNNDHIAIEDSNIVQGKDSAFNYLGPLNLQACTHCEISGNSIAFSVGGMLFDKSTDMVFENNQVIRDISVAPDAGTVTHSIAANFVVNLALLNNTFNSVGGAMPNNNDGEVVVTEGGGPRRSDEFRGSITSISASTLTDASQYFLYSPNASPSIQIAAAMVSIVSGNGLGQTRLVTGVSADGRTLTIDRPWDVLPDVDSHYATFDWSAQNWTVVNNSLNGNFKGFEVFNASASNLLFEKNTLTDSDGIMISPGEHIGSSDSPALFNVVENLSIVGNTFTDRSGLRPAYVGLIPREDIDTAAFGTHILGATVKANNVTGFSPNVFNVPANWDDYKVVTEGYLCDYFWQSNTNYSLIAPPPLLANIFQGNMAWGSRSAFYLNSGAVQTVIADSYMNNVGSAKQDVALLGSTVGSQETEMINNLSLFSVGATTSSLDLLEGTASYYGGPAIALGHQGANPYSVATAGDALVLFGAQFVGNMDIVSHVTLTPNTSASGVLMMRESTASKSAMVAISLSSGGIVVATRSTDGAAMQSTSAHFGGTAVWLRLQYSGTAVKAMFSADGRSWTQLSAKATFAKQTFLAGVADLSTGSQAGVETTFDSLAFSPQ